jgi:hypothetical protein
MDASSPPASGVGGVGGAGYCRVYYF